jgi:hypothetical protein
MDMLCKDIVMSNVSLFVCRGRADADVAFQPPLEEPLCI